MERWTKRQTDEKKPDRHGQKDKIHRKRQLDKQKDKQKDKKLGGQRKIERHRGRDRKKYE